MANKMNWLIDKFNNGTVEYIINESGRHHGAISCPTGYGKSGIIFTDIIKKIMDSQKNGAKLVVNLTTPIIKLCAQQGVDLLQTIEGIYKTCNIDKSKIVIFNNNSGDIVETFSDNNESVFAKCGYNCFRFTEISSMFINNDMYNVAIVISCNRSMHKFIDYFYNHKILGIDIACYLDEAHTISVELEDNDETDKIKLNELCQICTWCYLISATNKQNLVKMVNSYETNDDDCFYRVSPEQAIKENVICSPAIGYTLTDDGKITPEICKSFMMQVKRDNNNIYHKILVTCNTTSQLNKLSKQLKDDGFTVFSTCSTNGMNGDETAESETEFSNCKTKYTDVRQFIDAINTLEDDCFVIHIRQMTSGIDISELTDAIISKADTDNYNSYDKVIQIIGRTLRLGNERGIEESLRKKKYSNILFVTPETNVFVNDNLGKFLISYYTADCIRFTKNFSTNKLDTSNTASIDLFEGKSLIKGSSSYLYNDVIINIKKYIEQYIVPQKQLSDDFALPFNELLDEHIKEIETKYCDFMNGSVYLTRFISNTELKNDVINLLHKYNIC